jgi:hypothetical protein
MESRRRRYIVSRYVLKLFSSVILVDEMGFEPTTSSLRTVGKIS